MDMTEILTKSYDDSGELSQFLVIEGGEPETKKASPENMLLYDPEDELPFDGGLSSFFDGDSALKLSDSVAVAQSSNSHSYVLSVDGSVVETMPERAEELLEGVYEAIAKEDTDELRSLYRDMIADQVRRDLINTLYKTFEERRRIEIVDNGWLIDGFYLVDWNAKMYAANDDPEEGDHVRSGSKTVKKDTTYEFVRMTHGVEQSDPIKLTVDESEYTLTEREMLFLTKVTWLLNRRHYHPDKPFWDFVDRWTDVDRTNPDVFDI